MKKTLIGFSIAAAFIAGLMLSEIVLSGINGIFSRPLFQTRSMMEQKWEEKSKETDEFRERLEGQTRGIEGLAEEIDRKDFSSLTRENLLSRSGVGERGKVRIQSGLNEIYLKSAGAENPGLNRIRENLNRKVQNMLEVSSHILKEKIQNLNMELLDVNRELMERNTVLKQSLTELEKYREELEDREKTIHRLEGIQDELQQEVGELKTKIEDGRLRVDFKGDILFASGRHRLTDRGKKLLASIIPVLRNSTDRNNIFIAGHTDNVPIRPQSRDKYASNWELSTFRAVEVVKFLVEQGLEPRHLTAAGYGKFKPVSDNESEAGRSRNRRVELFLIPRIIKRSPGES